MSYIWVVLYISINTWYINVSMWYSLRFKLLAASASSFPSPPGGEAAEPPWGRGRCTCLENCLQVLLFINACCSFSRLSVCETLYHTSLYLSLSLSPSLFCLNACLLASLYALMHSCMRLHSTIWLFQNFLAVTSTFSFTSSRGVFTHKKHMTQNLKVVFFAPPIINLC